MKQFGRTLRDKRGVMVIEFLIASALAFLAAMGVASGIVVFSKHLREGSTRVVLQQDLSAVATRMAIEIRRADSFVIYDPVNPNVPLVNGPAVKLLDGNGVRINGFRLVSGAVVNDLNAGLNHQDFRITRLFFRTVAAGSIEIDMDLVDPSGNQVTIETEVSPRN